MNIEYLKSYLQNYLDDVIIPYINGQLSSYEETIKMNLYDIVKGSYQPPIYHIFIDVVPHDILKSDLKKTESEISPFF
jgi:hypothetical protein